MADPNHAPWYQANAAGVSGGVIAKARARANRERFENELDFEIRAARLPEPIRQHYWAKEMRNANGRPRMFTADFAWPEYRLIVEVQGGVWRRGGGAHSHPTNIERDIEKAQCAVLLGWVVFPVTTDDVRSGKAINLVTRALAARGWRRVAETGERQIAYERLPA